MPWMGPTPARQLSPSPGGHGQTIPRQGGSPLRTGDPPCEWEGLGLYIPPLSQDTPSPPASSPCPAQSWKEPVSRVCAVAGSHLSLVW